MVVPEVQAYPRIVDSTKKLSGSQSLLGGKAANLATLCGANLPVPPWICVTPQVFAPLLDRVTDLIEPFESTAADDRGAQSAAARRIREALTALPLADED